MKLVIKDSAIVFKKYLNNVNILIVHWTRCAHSWRNTKQFHCITFGYRCYSVSISAANTALPLFSVNANNIQQDSAKLMEDCHLHESGCWPKHYFHIICVRRLAACFVDAVSDGELHAGTVQIVSWLNASDKISTENLYIKHTYIKYIIIFSVFLFCYEINNKKK